MTVVAGFCLIGCLLLALVFLGEISKQRTARQAAEKTAHRTRLSATCKIYMRASTGNDRWWLTESQDPSPSLSYALDAAMTNVQKAIASSANASPLAGEIALTFTNFLITEYVNGSAIAISKGDLDPKAVPHTIEICFVSEKDFRSGSEPTMLWYKANWDAVMMGAIEWPSPYFDSVLMHEIGHAHWKRMKGQPPNFSHDWFEDEVIMHELQTAVLNLKTDKKYLEKLQEICKAHGAVQSAAELLAKVSADELLELDKIINVENHGHDVRGAACFHHIVALGFSFIDLHQGSVEDKIGHYRWAAQK